jgi:osmotically-inducible protein OsmY
MRRMNSVGTWVGIMALTVMGAACSERTEDSAAEAARESSEAAADAARAASDAAGDAARATGQAANDAATGVGAALDNAGRAADAAVETMDVKAALVADTRIDASGVNVDTNHTTKTVILKGTVPTAAQRTLAEQIATKQAAGYRVQNNLAVGPAR